MVAALRHDSGLLDHALYYAALGLAVLPLHAPVATSTGLRCSCGNADCGSPAKHPIARLAPQGLKNASVDASIVTPWFSTSGRNIGIATGHQSGIVVLDVDPRHGGDESLVALERQWGPLPVTWRFLTGGGGMHIIFRHPGGRVSNSAGQIAPGLDLRADGGYIVAPPSVHISGRAYAVSVDHHPDEVELAAMPDWLEKAVRTPTARSPADRQGKGAPLQLLQAPIASGGRNHALTQVAGKLFAHRHRMADVLDLLLFINKHACAPPLDDDEIVKIVASLATREYAKDFRRE